jgi:hypothetical protein
MLQQFGINKAPRSLVKRTVNSDHVALLTDEYYDEAKDTPDKAPVKRIPKSSSQQKFQFVPYAF